MKFVLDSNIFIADFHFKSNDFKLLLDFINKQHHKLVLPRIVWEEIQAVHRRTIKKEEELFNGSKLKLIRYFVEKEISDFTLNLEGETEKYGQFVLSQLKMAATEILAYNDAHLAEIADRAVNRIPPCSSSGEEFRDTMIWLSVLDIASSDEDRTIVFISADKHFCQDLHLHPRLSDEATQRDVTVLFYPSIDSFMKEHVERITHPDDSLLDEVIDSDQMKEQLFKDIGVNEERLYDWMERRDKYPTGFYAKELKRSEIVDSYSYKISDREVFVRVYASFELLVVFDYEEVDESHPNYDWEWGYDCSRFPQVRTVSRTSTFSFSLDVKIGLLFEDDKIRDLSIDGWEITWP
jgi:predicted nucleic acid-binding protein